MCQLTLLLQEHQLKLFVGFRKIRRKYNEIIIRKVIVIMGASSGIGEATARLLARKGAKLVIAARRQERLIAIKRTS